MRYRFPKIELPSFEPHYGTQNKEAKPLPNPVTYNFKKEDTNSIVNCIDVNVYWFDINTIHRIERLALQPNDDEIYLNDRNTIIRIYKEKMKKISIKDVIKEMKSEIIYVMRIFTFLEMHKLINCIEIDYTSNEGTLEYERYKESILDNSTKRYKEDTKDCEHKIDRINLQCTCINNRKDTTNTYTNTKQHKIDRIDTQCTCTNNRKNTANTYTNTKQHKIDRIDLQCTCINDCKDTTNLYVNTKDYFFICYECYKNGKYSYKYTSTDFIELTSEYKENIWSKKDELILLELIENKREWSDIASILGKTSKACILHFLRMNIKISTLKESIDNKFNDDMCLSYNEAFNTHINNSTLKIGKETQRDDICFVPPYFLFNNLTNPIMSFVSFLTSNLHPRIGAETAKYYLKNLLHENIIDENVIKQTVLSAEKQKEREEIKEERLWNVLVELQLKKIEYKLIEFEEIMKSNAKEKKQYELVRDNYLKEFEEFKRQYL